MSVSVGKNEQRIKAFYRSNKKKQGLKYLNTKRIKTHRRPCCADLCMRMDLPLDKKLWKIRTGPPGRRAVGPWRAVAGRGGPWRAVGLLLAKPWIERVLQYSDSYHFSGVLLILFSCILKSSAMHQFLSLLKIQIK